MYDLKFAETLHSKSNQQEWSGLSMEEKFMKIVTSGTTHQDGHYQVPLPFKNNNVVLPSNRNQTMKRLQYLRRRFNKDENFKNLHVKSMRDMLK